MQQLAALLDELPEELRRQSLTHASWVEARAEGYERLAFLGDSVLELAISTHLFPRLDETGPGPLTKVRAQAVSGRSCRAVAERLQVPARMKEVADELGAPAAEAANEALLRTERVLASVCEAIIGACYLTYGYERTAEAIVDAFAPEVAEALERPADFKSALQERLARRGELVAYEVTQELGPPHDRTFEVVARVGEAEVARGTGKSKKDAEQAAAETVLADLGAVKGP